MKVKRVQVSEPFAYNRIFEPVSGYMARWGKTQEDDPLYSPVGPEILDLEVSTGSCSMNCPFCYKGNTAEKGTNMSLSTFKQVISKFSNNLDSIAFGITDIQANPDFIPMMKESRARGIVPNFTMSGIDLTPEIADEIAPLIGACAVSVYQRDKNLAYNAIKMMLDRGVSQTNIHLFVSRETIDFVYEVLNDVRTDERLANLNAVVFLGVKPKGRAKGHFHSLNQGEFSQLIKFCMTYNIPHGFDSCSAPKYVQAVVNMDLSDAQKESMLQAAESCESFGMFSAYVNVHGEYFPCSFCEGEVGWETGMNVLECEDFVKDIWFSDKLNKWREMSIASMDCHGCRKCLVFKEIN